MNQWTDDAVQALEGYLERNRRQVAAYGADPDEVVSDLRRHVEEEVAELSVVTEDDVERIVTQLGPVRAEPARESPPALPSPRTRAAFPSWLGAACALFGILLPLIALVFELVTGLCAGTFFDPLPTWF